MPSFSLLLQFYIWNLLFVLNIFWVHFLNLNLTQWSRAAVWYCKPADMVAWGLFKEAVPNSKPISIKSGLEFNEHLEHKQRINKVNRNSVQMFICNISVWVFIPCWGEASSFWQNPFFSKLPWGLWPHWLKCSWCRLFSLHRQPPAVSRKVH